MGTIIRTRDCQEKSLRSTVWLHSNCKSQCDGSQMWFASHDISMATKPLHYVYISSSPFHSQRMHRLRGLRDLGHGSLLTILVKWTPRRSQGLVEIQATRDVQLHTDSDTNVINAKVHYRETELFASVRGLRGRELTFLPTWEFNSSWCFW